MLSTGRRRCRLVLVALFAVIALLLGGCLHMNASMTISDDDRVSGELLMTTRTPDGKAPFNLRPPTNLADRVHVTPYSAEGRTGSQLTFRDLSFDEVEQLSQALSPSGSRYKLRLSRSGSLVNFDGSVDLTPLTNTDSSFDIEVSAPGEVTSTNGRESAGQVSWSPEPGEVTQLSATFQYSGSGVAGWIGWAVLVGFLTFGVAGLVAWLAQRAHEQAGRAAGDRVL